MPKSQPKPVETLTFEEAYAELETNIAALESGEGPLEASMTAFTRGQALLKRCAELLDAAELKVKQLTGETLTDFKEAA
jgi:exodeoxyribonuclease VII small subunit